MYKLGIDIGSTTVKVALLDKDNRLIASNYKRHFAKIRETLSDLLSLGIDLKYYHKRTKNPSSHFTHGEGFNLASEICPPDFLRR